jgi:hypothetical protein
MKEIATEPPRRSDRHSTVTAWGFLRDARINPFMVSQTPGEGGKTLSARRHGPFVAALPETLVEGELFGYERGVFRGAFRRKQGWFEMARGGTLVLDLHNKRNRYDLQ